MTNTQLQELHELNAISDLELLKKMLEYCNEEDKEEIEHLIYLNNEVGIGWSQGDYTPAQEQEYFDRKFALLAKYDDLNKWMYDE